MGTMALTLWAVAATGMAGVHGFHVVGQVVAHEQMAEDNSTLALESLLASSVVVAVRGMDNMADVGFVPPRGSWMLDHLQSTFPQAALADLLQA